MKNKEDVEFIGKVLTEAGLISDEQLRAALEEQEKTDRFIFTTLANLGFVKEQDLLVFLSSKLGIPYVTLKEIDISSAALEKMPARFASHYKAIPVEFKDNILTVAVVNPLDIYALDDIRTILGVEVKGVLASEQEIEEMIRKYYGVGADTIEKMAYQKPQAKKIKEEPADEVESAGEDASMITFVDQILREAAKDRATDIHLEPFEDGLQARFRIDGVLYNINLPESIRHFYPSIVSRIKIMASLDIAEHRLPQDGRIRISIESQELDLRVSIIPTGFGESVHIRILSSRFFLALENLGLLSSDLQLIEEAIKKPHGIILVTGPTGSGKSTTLYAALSKINVPGRKIITIEDPVEYQLKGISQIQVVPKIGLSFSQGLRHMLRHDPDVMMIGEIRDFETAEIAIRAALTGHLVFSTLHTNDAAGAITRLLDMGVEPFLLASSLEYLIAQRLVRIICPVCKRKVESKKEMLNKIKILDIDESVDLYEGAGCKECRFTGFKGRTGIYEIIQVTEPIRELILGRSSSQHIKQRGVLEGMNTLIQDGFQKVLMGLTTMPEVIRVTQQE